MFTDSIITDVFDFLAIDWVTDTKKENFVKITEKEVVSYFENNFKEIIYILRIQEYTDDESMCAQQIEGIE